MTFEEVKAKFIGKSDDPQVYEVEKGSAKRYAVAVADLNPLYLDEEVAGASKYRTTVAPPGFFGWPVKQPSPQFSDLQKELMEELGKAGFPDILDGGSDFEFMLPVRAGDILVHHRHFADLMSRAGARKMAFTTIENSYTNQNGQLVAKVRQTLIALSKVA